MMAEAPDKVKYKKGEQDAYGGKVVSGFNPAFDNIVIEIPGRQSDPGNKRKRGKRADKKVNNPGNAEQTEIPQRRVRHEPRGKATDSTGGRGVNIQRQGSSSGQSGDTAARELSDPQQLLQKKKDKRKRPKKNQQQKDQQASATEKPNSSTGNNNRSVQPPKKENVTQRIHDTHDGTTATAGNPSEGHVESDATESQLVMLKKDHVFQLKEKSTKFPDAKYRCDVCDYHCDSVAVCQRHIKDRKHKRLLQAWEEDQFLLNLPAPSKSHIEAMNVLLASIEHQHALTTQDTDMREELIDRLNQKVKQSIPDCQLCLYGSSANGFGLKGSDVNIDVNIPKKLQISKVLLEILDILKSCDDYIDVISEFTIKIPTINFTDRKTGLNCKLCYTETTACQQTTGLLATYAKVDPRMKTLGVAFRYWAQLCHIDKQLEGSLPPHTLPLMVVYFLQQCQPPVLPVLHGLLREGETEKNKLLGKDSVCSYYDDLEKLPTVWKCQNNCSVGELWIDLFKFYGLNFKMADLVVCIKQSSPFKKEVKKWSTKKIAVEDPYMPKRNLARSVNSQLVFEYIMDRLKDGVKYFGTPNLSSNKEQMQSGGKVTHDTAANNTTHNNQRASQVISEDKNSEGETTSVVSTGSRGNESVIDRVKEEGASSEMKDKVMDAESAKTVEADTVCEKDSVTEASISGETGDKTTDENDSMVAKSAQPNVKDDDQTDDVDNDERVGRESSEEGGVKNTSADVESSNSVDIRSGDADEENSKTLSFTTEGATSETTELAAKTTDDDVAQSNEPLESQHCENESEDRDKAARDSTLTEQPANTDSDITQAEGHALPCLQDQTTAISGESNSTCQLTGLEDDMTRLRVDKDTTPVIAGSCPIAQTKDDIAGDFEQKEQEAGYSGEMKDAADDSCGVVNNESTPDDVIQLLLEDMLDKTLEDIEANHSDLDSKDEDDDEYETISEDSDVAVVADIAEDEDESESETQSESGYDGDDDAGFDNDGVRKDKTIGNETDVHGGEGADTKQTDSKDCVEEMDYDTLMEFVFDQIILTNGGKKPMIVCNSCKREGHGFQNCPDDRVPNLPKLPKLPAENIRRIDHLCRSMLTIHAPSEREVNMREDIMRDLEKFIQKQIDPDAELCLFGSSMNGFGFNDSDLDICMTYKGIETSEGLQRPAPEIIEQLAGKIKKYHGLYGVVPIPTAKVPIVKFTLRKGQLEGDISLYNTLAQHNTKMLGAYADIDVRVKQLGYTIKVFAKMCDIGDASRGSLSSYAYILMMLFFLQQRKPPVIPVLQELHDGDEKPERIVDNWNAWFYDDIGNLAKVWPDYGKNHESVGELWLGLLKFYTEEFNFKENVISIRQLQPLTRFEKMWTSKCIAIEDPFDLTHNLGAGVSRKMNNYIMSAFQKGRLRFGMPYREYPHYADAVDYYFDVKYLTDEGGPPNDRGCRICGKIGHYMKDCPRRRRKNSEKNKDGEKTKDDTDGAADMRDERKSDQRRITEKHRRHSGQQKQHQQQQQYQQRQQHGSQHSKGKTRQHSGAKDFMGSPIFQNQSYHDNRGNQHHYRAHQPGMYMGYGQSPPQTISSHVYYNSAHRARDSGENPSQPAPQSPRQPSQYPIPSQTNPQPFAGNNSGYASRGGYDHSTGTSRQHYNRQRSYDRNQRQGYHRYEESTGIPGVGSRGFPVGQHGGGGGHYPSFPSQSHYNRNSSGQQNRNYHHHHQQQGPGANQYFQNSNQTRF